MIRSNIRTIGRLAAALGLATVAASASAAPAATTVVHDVNLVTLDERGVIAGASVVTREGKIVAILTGSDPLPAGARVIEGNGGYLIPGLIDAHVHYDQDNQLARYLRYGVTTVFSLGTGGSLDPLMQARRRIADGSLVGAHLYATGPAIANHRILATPAEAEPFLDEMRKDGFEYVKVYNEIPQDVFDAVVAGAHRRGMGVFGHMPRRFPPEYSITHGLDVIAHMEELFFTEFKGPRDKDLAALTPDWTPDYAKVDPILDLIAANHVAIIPNLTASHTFRALWADEDKEFGLPDAQYLDAETRDDWRKYNASHRDQVAKRMLREELKYPLIRLMTYRAQQKGVLLLAGTDAPIPTVYPGRSLHQELRLLVAAGLTNEEALRTATINGGEATRRFVDAHACIGVIRAGCEADLVLLKANPLEDIRAVDGIVGVMNDGKYFVPEELDRLSLPR